MDTGLLWLDDDPSATLADKVRRAARAYRRKHGVRPDTCFVHPSQFAALGPVGGVAVRPLGSVLRHHLWIGVEDG